MTPELAPRIRAVVPSLAGTADRLALLSQSLGAAGAEPFVIPTGARVERALRSAGIRHLTIGANPGFAATIAHGAQGEWDWLLIVNDDVTIDDERLAGALAGLEAYEPDARVLSFLDPVPPRPVPSRTDALLGLSLWGPLLSRLGIAATTRRRAKTCGYYRPFSCVAVSRALWDDLNGLDQRFIYTFEDADFTRRAHAAGASVCFPDDTGVTHKKYSTSSKYIGTVLPCAAVSTAVYLEAMGMQHGRARAACVVALLARLPLTLLGRLPRREHIVGIGGALRSIVLDRRPCLPDYATN